MAKRSVTSGAWRRGGDGSGSFSIFPYRKLKKERSDKRTRRRGDEETRGRGEKNLPAPSSPCLPVYLSPLLFFDHLWAGTDDVCKGQRECAHVAAIERKDIGNSQCPRAVPVLSVERRERTGRLERSRVGRAGRRDGLDQVESAIDDRS
jgi:hypothetical protein